MQSNKSSFMKLLASWIWDENSKLKWKRKLWMHDHYFLTNKTIKWAKNFHNLVFIIIQIIIIQKISNAHISTLLGAQGANPDTPGASPFSLSFVYVHYTTHRTYSFTSHPKDGAIMVKCLAQGHKRRDRPGRDSNPHSDNTRTWVQCTRPLGYDIPLIKYMHAVLKLILPFYYVGPSCGGQCYR